MGRSVTELPGVVMTSAYNTWADALRRDMCFSPDRVAARLLHDQRIPAVTIVDPPRRRIDREAQAAHADPAFQLPGRSHLQPRTLRIPATRQAKVEAVEKHDRWVARRAPHPSVPTVLVTGDPLHAAFYTSSRWQDVIYYAWDDWAEHPPFVGDRELYRQAYRRMAERNVRVCAVSEVLAERIGSARSIVVPNATVSADYDRLSDPPRWFTKLSDRKIAFYAGALERRVDVAALIELARELPDWWLVIVGPKLEPDVFRSLEDEPNVVIGPQQKRSMVLAMAARSTVCLIPHLRTPMTEAMSPLKLYEYLGTGCPVVAADLPPMRGVSPRCLLVSPGDRLAPRVELAATLPAQPEDDRRKWLRNNDWDSRYAVWRRFALGD